MAAAVLVRRLRDLVARGDGLLDLRGRAGGGDREAVGAHGGLRARRGLGLLLLVRGHAAGGELLLAVLATLRDRLQLLCVGGRDLAVDPQLLVALERAHALGGVVAELAVHRRAVAGGPELTLELLDVGSRVPLAERLVAQLRVGDGRRGQGQCEQCAGQQRTTWGKAASHLEVRPSLLVPTGLADGLALKECATPLYGGDSPRGLTARWVPRSATVRRLRTRLGWLRLRGG